jgi:hypothetical protein|tara:strand:+ start:803 stop:1276 length:474 start_codon:yes stop_codon:yes gene_type:complete
MLDPLSAYAACKSGIALIEQGIKTGKKLHDLASSVSKWANAESSLDVHAANKGKGGMLSKLGLSSIEEDAMAAYLRKKEIKEKKDQLREIFLLYADNGLQEWENLQAEIGRLRKRKKEQLRQEMEEREQIKKAIGIGVLVVLVLLSVVIYGKIFKWF